MGPRNRFQGMNSASLCSLAGRYANPLPPRFLAPIDSLKIPAQTSRADLPQPIFQVYGIHKYCTDHGLINYEDPDPKCRLYWCLIEFIDWRYSHIGPFDRFGELWPL
jgi:hypothetical protein